MTDDDLHRPELSTADVVACVPGLSVELFKQWQNRGHIVPLDAEGPGKGRRRLYAPIDAIQAATIFELQRQGIIVSKAPFVWQLVNLRLMQMSSPMPGAGGEQTMLLYINPANGELVHRVVYETDDGPADTGLERDDAPDVCVIFRTDRFIGRVLGRVKAVLADEPVPTAPDPTAGAESPEEFLRIYETDAQGRRVCTGLTWIETAEYEALRDGEGLSDEEFERYEVLQRKHEKARFARINAEILARSNASNGG